MTELNDEYDSVVVDSEYNILIALKNGLFDFCGLSVNGKSINPAGIRERWIKQTSKCSAAQPDSAPHRVNMS
ncbi:hypothetical protein GTU61_22895 [Klebsiella pneumoniae]|uniref:hypothetical protein n=1 Tax=Klebsiella pneumoniae TaxID=573 RepID=UPI0035D09D20